MKSKINYVGGQKEEHPIAKLYKETGGFLFKKPITSDISNIGNITNSTPEILDTKSTITDSLLLTSTSLSTTENIVHSKQTDSYNDSYSEFTESKNITEDDISKISLDSDKNIDIFAFQQNIDQLTINTLLYNYIDSPFGQGPQYYFGKILQNRSYKIVKTNQPGRVRLENTEIEYDNSYNSFYSYNPVFKGITQNLFTHLKANWMPYEGDNYKINQPSTQSCFGKLVLDGEYKFIIIPLNKAIDNEHLLHFFGCKLTKFGDTLPYSNVEVDLVNYNFLNKIRKNSDCDSRLFLKIDNFPNYIINSHKKSFWKPIIGKYIGGRSYLLTSFSIPRGYSLFIPPGVIHDDWYTLCNEIVSLIPSHGDYYSNKVKVTCCDNPIIAHYKKNYK